MLIYDSGNGEVHKLEASWEEIQRAWAWMLKERKRIREKSQRRRDRIKEQNKDLPARSVGRPKKPKEPVPSEKKPRGRPKKSEQLETPHPATPISE